MVSPMEVNTFEYVEILTVRKVTKLSTTYHVYKVEDRVYRYFCIFFLCFDKTLKKRKQKNKTCVEKYSWAEGCRTKVMASSQVMNGFIGHCNLKLISK